MSLPDIVKLIRSETPADPRPNKALDPRLYARLLHDYEHQLLMIRIANHGFRVCWLHDVPRQSTHPKNHRSADAHAAAVVTRILEGVEAGTYVLLHRDILAQWGVHVSSFGVVPKAHDSPQPAIRLIHDLSFPSGQSVNDATQQSSLPPVNYEFLSALARRIEDLHCRHPGIPVLLLKGDVQGAFRHLRQFAEDVRWLGGLTPLQDAGVIDLSAPFGWTGSPALYGVFGLTISFLVGRESPATMYGGDVGTTPFFQYEWVDDHVMIEASVGQRCRIAEDVLRLAMLAVFGPNAINESKFTPWSTTARILGLDWDSSERTVSMPPDKIAKALHRVSEARKTHPRYSYSGCWGVSVMYPRTYERRARFISDSTTCAREPPRRGDRRSARPCGRQPAQPKQGESVTVGNANAVAVAEPMMPCDVATLGQNGRWAVGAGRSLTCPARDGKEGEFERVGLRSADSLSPLTPLGPRAVIQPFGARSQ